MRLSLRFLVPLACALAAIAYAVVPLVDRLTLRWFIRDLDIRSTLVANAVQEPLQELVDGRNKARVQRFFNKLITDERIYAVGFCDAARAQLVATQPFPSALGCRTLDTFLAQGSPLLPSDKGPLHVAVHPVETDGRSCPV